MIPFYWNDVETFFIRSLTDLLHYLAIKLLIRSDYGIFLSDQIKNLHESVATYKEPTDGKPLWTDRNDKEKVKNEWASERAAIISLLLLTRKFLYCTSPREVSFLWVIKVC